MEKRLRSSLQSSAEEFLSTATKLGFTKSTKSSLKSLIYSLKSSTPLVSSLPLFLNRSISDSVNRFKTLSEANPQLSPKSPPTKRIRRSSRNGNTDTDGSTASENAKVFTVESLMVYSYVSIICITHPKGVFSATELLPGVCELHDSLVLFESHSVLLCEIANLCEEWWKKDLEGKENLISQLLPFLVARSLTLKKKVDVHRIYILREAFSLLDFEDESIEDLKHLLLRCLISPLYLKTEDGRKFLAFIFTLSGQLVKESLAMIKSQIPFGKKSILEAYGEIVFRAWKAVESDLKEEIENAFVQALIEGAIHASSGAFAASIRRVLGGFIMQRTTNGVEKFLYRLAEPVIFRSLQVANSNVRQNALHLMLDLFPIEDPDATKEGKDTLLDKQFFLLEKLLMDDSPDVRVTAVEGGCRILHMFWEVIPSPTITKLLTKFFDTMTHDGCTEVRLSTVNGIIYLLGNPYSHEVLKVLLPRLNHLVNDLALAVRVAVIDLLLVLADIQKFQFHKVVPLDALLSTLAEDHQFVGQKITKLLIPSYFPLEVTLKEASTRFMALIRRSPLAGARFCEFVLQEGASYVSLKELFGELINLVLSPVKLNTELIYALLKAASHLCDNLVKDESYESALKQEMSPEKLKSLFSVAAKAHAQSFICKIVTAISPGTVDPGLFKECMCLIMDCMNLCSDVKRQDEMRTSHKMILACDWFDNMFESMAKHLRKTAKQIESRFGIASRKSNTLKKQFDKEYAVATGIAWQIKDLLSSENTCKAILRSKSLEIAFHGLKILSEISLMQCIKCDSMNSIFVMAYSTLVIHMSLSNVNVKGIKFKIKNHETVLLDIVLEQLLYHANKLLEESEGPFLVSRTEGQRSDNVGIMKPNVLKMLTAVLKFIIDTTTMELNHHCQEILVKFNRNYLELIISNSTKYSVNQHQFNDDDSREMFLCLRSSLTYTAKHISFLLQKSDETTPLSLQQPYTLSNCLFDVIVSTEENLGYGLAARLVSGIKSWIPDFVLALGYWNLIKNDSFPSSSFPLWVRVLAKTEVIELYDETFSDRIPSSCAIRKVIEMMVNLLKSNHEVIDNVGSFLLDMLVIIGLERKDFDVVLGLLHFVCLKLVKNEENSGEFKLMLGLIEAIYVKIEVAIRDSRNNGSESSRKKLKIAKELVENVWMEHFSFEEE